MPSLNNGLKGFYIDGKAVRKASLDGKVFFEKHNYDLNVVADKNIISAYDGESATLTATLTDFNEPVSGETVIFSSDSPIETTDVDSSGTYDFGERFVINCSNLPEIQYINHGIQIGQNPSVWISRNLNGNLDIMFSGGSVMSNVDDPIIIEEGVLKAYSFIYNRYLTRDISDVDLTEWILGEDISGTIIPVEHYFYESAVTDSQGECSVSYVGKGAGDLNIKIDCMDLQKTYVIEDCIFYHPEAIKYSGTSRNDTVYSLGYDEIADLSNINFECSWKFHQTSMGADFCLGASSEFSVSPIKSNYRVFIGGNDSGSGRYGSRTTSSSTSLSGTVTSNIIYDMKIIRNGNTFDYYLNNGQMGSKPVTFFSNYNMFGIHTVQWNYGTTTISEIKIKKIINV